MQSTMQTSTSPPPRRRRTLALTLAVVFAGLAAGTTVASLGRYCLTSDGGDVRRLALGRATRVGSAPPAGTGCAVPARAESTPGGSTMSEMADPEALPLPQPLPDPPAPARTATAAFAVG